MSRMPIIAAFLLFVLSAFTFSKLSLAENPPAGQIERSHELLEKERALLERLNRQGKVYIKRIIVESRSLLTGEEVNEIILPFQRQWLNKEDIEEIIGLIIEALSRKGYDRAMIDVSHEVNRKQLVIKVRETE